MAASEKEGQRHLPTDHAPVLIARCDTDCRYTFVNNPYAARFGLHPREVIGRHIRDVLGGPAFAIIEGYIDAALAGERVEFEAELSFDGTGPQVVRCAYDPEFDAAGRVVGFVAAIVNLTDARGAREAQRESEERFARFMHHLPGLAWIKDDRGRYVYANDAAVTAFGTPRADLYGRTDEAVFPPATAALFRENDRKALAAGAGVRTVEALEHPGGVVRHSLVSKFPIPGPDGEPPMVGGMAIDITEEMRTRAVLEESEERFRATFDQAAVGIAHVGTDGRWLRVNRKLCDIAGYSPDELMGLTFQDITHPDDVGADLAQLRRLVAGDITTYAMEKRYVRKDRRTVWVNLTVSLVRTPRGEPKYLISVVEDITGKRQAQDALRESEERLRTLSNNLPHGAIYQVLADPGGSRRFTYVSAGVERVVGVTPAEAMADAAALYGLVHEDDRPRVAAAEEVALRDLSPFDCEFRFRPRSGLVVWVHARSAPRRLPTGQTAWEGILTDVTARKRAEEELARVTAESERRRRLYEAALSNTPDLVYVFGLDHRFAYANEGLLRMWGKTWDGAVGRNCLELGYEPWHAEMHDREIEQVVATRQPVKGEVPFTGTFGRRDYEYILVPVLGETGEVEAVAGTTRDVTERRRAEQTIRSLLRVSERLNSTLDVDALLDALVQEAIGLVDAEAGVAGLNTPEGMVCKRYFQKGAVLPLDYRWPPMHGLPGWLLVHKTPYLTNDALADPQIVHDLCVRFGVRSALSTPILDSAGEVLGFFEVHNTRVAAGFGPTDRDMLLAVSQTAAVAIQNALAYGNVLRAEEALKDADRRKDQWVMMLAHELRNPLAPIRTAAEVIQKPDADRATVEKARGVMDRQVRHLARIIEDLLDVSRLIRGRVELRPERLDLGRLARAVVGDEEPTFAVAGIRLDTDLPELPVWVNADPTRLTQVLDNLLNNAAKFTDRGGTVVVRAGVDTGDRRAVLAVRDTGVGIEPVLLPHLFETFTQADASLDRTKGGLGLGLSVVKGLVELHGGTVEARSDGPGRGAEFVVRLPLQPEPAAVADVPARPGRAPKRLRVLVVEDNQDAADSLKMLLEVFGYEVSVAYTGPSGVEAAAAWKPDAVVCDIGLPGLDGYGVARALRQNPGTATARLIAVTGYGGDEDRLKSREAGFDAHLTKPADPTALQDLLASTRSTA